jgi:PadR family transcriptional regulator, regulatory protein PadR
MADKNPSLMAGVPELVVLSLLADREMYGYEIARSIKTVTQDLLNVGEGVLHPALHLMESRRLLRSCSIRVDGRMRIYYCVTAKGKTRLARLTSDWRRMSQGVESILGSPIHA